jgi:hypothetical protein
MVKIAVFEISGGTLPLLNFGIKIEKTLKL